MHCYSVCSGMCSVTSVAMAMTLGCDIICHHDTRLAVGTERYPPWSVCLRHGPIRSPALWAAAQRSKVRWWTWKRTHGGAGCGPAGGREGRSEPQWLPPPKPAASAPSSCPSCDIRGSDIIKHNPSERRERKGVHKHLQKKSLKNF